MRKIVRTALAVFVLSVAAATPFTARADTLPAPTASYDGDVAIDYGTQHFTANVNVSGPKMRITATLPVGRQVILADRSTGQVFLLVPSLNTALQLDRSSMGGFDLRDLATLNATPNTPEVIAGIEAVPYFIKGDNEYGSFRGRVWMNRDGIPIRLKGTTTRNGEQTPVTMELTNLHQGEQMETYFNVPDSMAIMPLPSARTLGSMKAVPLTPQ